MKRYKRIRRRVDPVLCSSTALAPVSIAAAANAAAATLTATSDVSRQLIDHTNYFNAMKRLGTNMRLDRRLSPYCALVYRSLCDYANSCFWSMPFAVSNDDLSEITGISREATIISIKQRLKSLGYIDFFGKPSHYTVFFPPIFAQPKLTPQLSPQPKPQFSAADSHIGSSLRTQITTTKTPILQNNQRKRKKEKERRNSDDQPNDSNANLRDSAQPEASKRYQALLSRIRNLDR